MTPPFIAIEYFIVFAAVCFVIVRGTARQPQPRHDVLITPGASDVMKAVCCIVIVLHHFALRRPDVLIIKPLAIGGGNLALPIFFILSAYGITKSELYKPVAQFGAFFKKRMLKLLKPLWMVNLFTIMAYALIGADGYTAEALAKARVNPLFCEIGSHGLPWWEYPLLLVGIKEIDGVVWFVEVTLYAYLAFFVSKSVFPIREKRRSFVCLYTALIVAFGIVAYALALPAHYYRNLWSLVLGLLLAVYEEELVGSVKSLRLLLFAIGGYVLLQCVFLREYLYFVFAMAAIFAVFLCGRYMARSTVRQGSALARLAAMSYMVYLLHVKLLAIEWHYLGYVSVLLPLAATLALAWVHDMVSSRKT